MNSWDPFSPPRFPKLFVGLLLFLVGVITVLVATETQSYIGAYVFRPPLNVPKATPTPSPSSTPKVSPTPSATPYTIGAGDYTYTTTVSGLTRRYLVHVPSSYKTSTAASLIIALHGGGGSADNADVQMQMKATSDAKGFLLVYPDGSGDGVQKSWNAGICCGVAVTNNVDDVGFISKMIDELKGKFNIDAKRVYATGHSNGAMMAYRLACDLSNKIAAIAPVGGELVVKTCSPSRPVSTLHIHGKDDPATAKADGDQCVFYEGGTQCLTCLATYYNRLISYYGVGTPISTQAGSCPAIPTSVDGWRKILALSSTQTTVMQKGPVTCTTFNKSATTQAPWGTEGAEVELCSVEGMGHTWPNEHPSYGLPCQNASSIECQYYGETVGALSSALSANTEMWTFFQKHPMK